MGTAHDIGFGAVSPAERPRLASQAPYQIADGDMFGWTVGAKLAGGNVNFDMGYSDVFAGTVSRRDTGLLFVNTSVRW